MESRTARNNLYPLSPMTSGGGTRGSDLRAQRKKSTYSIALVSQGIARTQNFKARKPSSIEVLMLTLYLFLAFVSPSFYGLRLKALLKDSSYGQAVVQLG